METQLLIIKNTNTDILPYRDDRKENDKSSKLKRKQMSFRVSCPMYIGLSPSLTLATAPLSRAIISHPRVIP